MKKKFSSFASFLILTLIVSCAGNDSPKAVAEHFLKAAGKLDFVEAKKYCTDETGKMLDMMESFAKMAPDSIKNKQPEFTLGEEKIDGDNATVSYKEGSKDGDQTVTLKKVDGKWKVAISKEGLMGGDKASAALDGNAALDSAASMMGDTTESDESKE